MTVEKAAPASGSVLVVGGGVDNYSRSRRGWI